MRELESVALQLELPPFDHAEVEQVLAGSVPRVSAQVVADVLERTQGNPLFVRHVARQLAGREGGSTADVPIPPGLRQAIRQRVQHVAEASALPQCLEAAAVLGADIDPELLGRVLGPDHPRTEATRANLAKWRTPSPPTAR